MIERSVCALHSSFIIHDFEILSRLAPAGRRPVGPRLRRDLGIVFGIGVPRTVPSFLFFNIRTHQRVGRPVAAFLVFLSAGKQASALTTAKAREHGDNKKLTHDCFSPPDGYPSRTEELSPPLLQSPSRLRKSYIKFPWSPSANSALSSYPPCGWNAETPKVTFSSALPTPKRPACRVPSGTEMGTTR